MPLTWTPLEVPAGATPEEAFAVGAVHSHDSKIILLAWIKGVGWCGCRGYEGSQPHPPPGFGTLLLRVDDVAIVAEHRTLPSRKGIAGDYNAPT